MKPTTQHKPRAWSLLGRVVLFTSLAVLAGAGGVTPRSLSAEDLGLTLLEAVDTALKENLSIRSDQYGISISESVVMAEEGAFDPFFRIEVTNEDTEVESASTLTATEEDVLRGDAVFGGRLRTGGTYELKLSNENVDSNLGFLLENPYYRSELTVSFTQPILKGVGRSVQESRLDVARNNLQIARLQLSATAVDVVAETMKAYWELHFAIDNLEVVKLSLELAWSLLDEVRARISAGEMASIEIYQAEAEVALRQGNVILARKALEDSEDRLKAAMGLIGWGAGIRPVTDPPPPLDPPPLDLAMRAAFENRKDYLQARLETRNKGILKRYYGNQKRSELDVIAATGINGVDGQYNEALSEMLEADSLSWQVGLLYTRPFGNRAAEGNYLRARYEEDLALTQLEALEQKIQAEVREAWRNLTTAIENITSTTKTRIAAEKKLEAEEEKFKAGKSTLNDVLTFQEEYARSLSREKRARIEYMIARTEIEQVKDTLDEELSSLLVAD